jgi:hypothetical protein
MNIADALWAAVVSGTALTVEDDVTVFIVFNYSDISKYIVTHVKGTVTPNTSINQVHLVSTVLG